MNVGAGGSRRRSAGCLSPLADAGSLLTFHDFLGDVLGESHVDVRLKNASIEDALRLGRRLRGREQSRNGGHKHGFLHLHALAVASRRRRRRRLSRGSLVALKGASPRRFVFVSARLFEAGGYLAHSCDGPPPRHSHDFLHSFSRDALKPRRAFVSPRIALDPRVQGSPQPLFPCSHRPARPSRSGPAPLIPSPPIATALAFVPREIKSVTPEADVEISTHINISRKSRVLVLACILDEKRLVLPRSWLADR